MKNSNESIKQSPFLYMEVYEHYRSLIISGVLKSSERMPSLRKAAAEMNRSLTTIESAYFQLAADGYIITRPQSGYYVTNIMEGRSDTGNEFRVIGESSAFQNAVFRERVLPGSDSSAVGRAALSSAIRYDFASSGVDRESFRFDLWQRYIKSALRQDERLLSYGEPQGEYDFREALSLYVRERRNILCSPEQIVVGAGVQTLLHLICPLVKDLKTVSFPTPSFIQGASVFKDHGFEVHYRDKNAGIIYVSPAHMNRWGDIMPVKRRLELIRHAGENGSLIIEDDYENEFVYLQTPTPSLYGLSRQQNVVYIGSFSRLLLPSIRISFMILPFKMLNTYREKASCYNQTASKAEQIALSRFIRDGHLSAQTRRLKRLYEKKQSKLCSAAEAIFGSGCTVKSAPAGTMVSLSVPFSESSSLTDRTPAEIQARAAEKGLRILPPDITGRTVTFLLSCSSMPDADFEEALIILKEIVTHINAGDGSL